MTLTRPIQTKPNAAAARDSRSPLLTRHSSLRLAFTLVEMLTVIAIIGIIAAMAMPVLKNFGKSDVNVSASRQLLDDVGHARQLAMSQRTTVYMVFLPTNFWLGASANLLNPSPFLTSTQQFAGSNLLDKQLTGYIDMA